VRQRERSRRAEPTHADDSHPRRGPGYHANASGSCSRCAKCSASEK
jgi:hypothetical protein